MSGKKLRGFGRFFAFSLRFYRPVHLVHHRFLEQSLSSLDDKFSCFFHVV